MALTTIKYQQIDVTVMDTINIEELFPNERDILICNESCHYSTIVGAAWQDFSWYASSYQLSFEVLVEHCQETIRHAQYLLLPVMFLFRHYVELKLKDILFSFFNLDNDREGFQKCLHHNIVKLWEAFRIKYDIHYNHNNLEKVDIDNAERIIIELSKIDSDSFKFRYPIDKREMKKSMDFQHVELRGFIETAEKMIRFLDAVKDTVENT